MIEQLLAVSSAIPPFNPPPVMDSSVFKGFVPADQLITGEAIAALVGLTAGAVINNDAGWLHFIDGTTEFYIARKNIRFGMSVADLTAAGLVAGRTVTFSNGDRYQVRLMSCMSQDPFSSIVTVAGGGEWNKYMYPLYAGPFRPDVTQWSSYSSSDLGLNTGNLPTIGSISVCRDKHTSITTALAARGWAYSGYDPNSAPISRQTVINDANINEGNASQGRNVYGFRPMLTKLPAFPVIGDNGPGPQSLLEYNETDTAGYFGLTTTAELFTINEIMAQAVTPPTGTIINAGTSNLWGKYTYEGKILYIPRQAVLTGVTWASLYSAGFIYGTNDNGKYPYTSNANFDVIPLTPVNQLRTITKTDADGAVWTFKIRTIRGMPTDPDANTADTNTRNSEYSRTIERTQPTNGIDVVWAQLGKMTGAIQCMETRGGSGGLQVYQLAGNGNGNAYYRSFSTKQNTGLVWVPVIELVSVVRP